MQRNWLVDFTNAFLDLAFKENASSATKTREKLGLTFQTPAPKNLFNLPGRIAALALTEDCLCLLAPATQDELTTSLVGGSITTQGLAANFYPAGFFTPDQSPDRKLCHWVNLTIPGQPSFDYIEESEFFAGGIFNGQALLTTIRLQLEDFSRVDLTRISEIALLFKQTPGGTLILNDIELVKTTDFSTSLDLSDAGKYA